MKNDMLSENALKIAKSRYFIDDDESWEELAVRVASVAASVENGARTIYTNNFAEMISEMDFLPGGRILRNIGRPRGSLFNCLSKDTEVISETRGLVKITDLDVNERILNGVGKFDTVKAVVNNGFKEKLLEITVEGFGKNNKILCTEDHRFLVFSFNEGFVWKKAIEVSDRDFMVMPESAFDGNIFSIDITNIKKLRKSDIDDNYSIFSVKDVSTVEYNDYVYDISMTDETNPHFTIIGAVSHNCYVLPCGDSIEEIGQYIKDSLILWSEGGGVGVNVSHLRPRGAIIRGKGGNSSGPVSFLEAANAVSKTIESGGARRAAALAGMHVSHPDILEFIDAKLVHGKLDHFNLSVAIDDKFLEAVEADGEWQFKFAQQNYGKIQARVIWDKIIENMVVCAEPGLLHWGNLTSNNSYYFDAILSTNPCGEVPLASYGVCDLGSLVLPNFITGNINTNWKKLEKTVKLAVRLLDNIIDVNKYVLKNIEIKAHNARRVGLGVMGLAEYLFAKKLRYGSKKAIYEIERLMRFIRDTAYEASVELAIEKGAFPKFDSTQYGKAHFIRSLPASLRMQIKKHGTRNVTLMAMAPTGTISLLPEVSSGIEPLFRKAYRRSDRVSDRIYVHPLYEKFLKEADKSIDDWFVDTDDLTPSDHFETQVAVQKFTDGAVSKTINMPSDTTTEDLSTLTMEYIYDLKGVTVYVDGSREGQILNKISEKEVRSYLESGNMDNTIDEETTKCATGSCEI